MKQRVTSMLQLAGLAVVALSVGAAAPALAQDSAKSGTAEVKRAADAKPAKPKIKTKGRTFTNSDLNRMYGVSPDEEKPDQVQVPQAASADSPGSSKSPLELMQEQQKNLRERETKIAEAVANVESAKQRVIDLEKRRLAVVNPFLARPKRPEEKEDAEKWDGMDERQRRDLTTEQLEQAKQAVTEAEAELAALRRGS